MHRDAIERLGIGAADGHANGLGAGVGRDRDHAIAAGGNEDCAARRGTARRVGGVVHGDDGRRTRGMRLNEEDEAGDRGREEQRQRDQTRGRLCV